MGAVTTGPQAGETWAYRRLPLDTPAAVFGTTTLAYGALGTGSTPPQLAFLSQSGDDGWQLAQTPRDEQDRPYRGPNPNPRSARLTPSGGGVLVGQDGARPPASQLVVLRRAARAASSASSARRRPLSCCRADDPSPGAPAEQLAGERGAGKVNVAAVDRGAQTMLFFVPVGRDVEGAVIANDGGDDAAAWRREPITLGGRDVLLGLRHRRDEPGERLARRRLARGPGAAAAPRRRAPRRAGTSSPCRPPRSPIPRPRPRPGITKVEPLGGQAQTITATTDGVWVDLRLDHRVRQRRRDDLRAARRGARGPHRVVVRPRGLRPPVRGGVLDDGRLPQLRVAGRGRRLPRHHERAAARRRPGERPRHLPEPRRRRLPAPAGRRRRAGAERRILRSGPRLARGARRRWAGWRRRSCSRAGPSRCVPR